MSLTNEKKIVDTFWENFNMSRCKTAMLVISIIITIAFVTAELCQIGNDTLQFAFFIVIGYWTGRTTKAKDKNISFDLYNLLIEKNGKNNCE